MFYKLLKKSLGSSTNIVQCVYCYDQYSIPWSKVPECGTVITQCPHCGFINYDSSMSFMQKTPTLGKVLKPKKLAK